MTDGRNLFDQHIRNDLKTNENIRKIAHGQRDDCTNSCLTDHLYFKKL